MSNQAYGIDKDSYVLRDIASKTSKDPKVYTVTGIIVTRFGDEANKGKYSGNTYKYYVWSHHKRIPDDNTNIDPEFIGPSQASRENTLVQESMLYLTYSNTFYEENEKVIVNKEGSHLEIVGTTNKIVPLPTKLTLDAPCKIELKIEKHPITYIKYYDDSEKEITGSLLSYPPSGSTEIQGGPYLKDSDILKDVKSERKEIKYITISSTDCTDSYISKLDPISKLPPSMIEENSNELEFYDGYKGPNNKVPVYARKLAKDREHLGGLIYASYDLVLPLTMEKDLKGLAKRYKKEFKAPLYVTSIFRTNEKQQELYKKFIDESSNANPAAKPGTSKHQSGDAIDFWLMSNPSDVLWYGSKNSDFKYKQSLPSEQPTWPFVYDFLFKHASDFGFFHPKGVSGPKGFEGWHWVYRGSSNAN